jgi:hypothetical protein
MCIVLRVANLNNFAVYLNHTKYLTKHKALCTKHLISYFNTISTILNTPNPMITNESLKELSKRLEALRRFL